MTPSPHHAPKARVFFALWPDAMERAALAAWQPPLHKLCGGRAMRPETLHATLVFVGEVRQERLEALQLAAQETVVKPFELCFAAAHYWGHNRIIYAAPAVPPENLSRLVETLEQRLVAHRFRFDRREYRPHVTLLRNAHWTDAPLPEMAPVCWRAHDFALVRSVPQGGKAGYQLLARFPLPPSVG